MCCLGDSARGSRFIAPRLPRFKRKRIAAAARKPGRSTAETVYETKASQESPRRSRRPAPELLTEC